MLEILVVLEVAKIAGTGRKYQNRGFKSWFRPTPKAKYVAKVLALRSCDAAYNIKVCVYRSLLFFMLTQKNILEKKNGWK